jgi:hypothetical protein
LTPEEQEARRLVLGRRSGARDARFPVARTEIRQGRERFPTVPKAISGGMAVGLAV